MMSIFVPFGWTCDFTLENVVFKAKNTNMERGLFKIGRTLPPICSKILVKLGFNSYLQNQNSNAVDFGNI